MEKNLNEIVDELLSKDGISGCMISDKHGLCLGCKGDPNPQSSGLLTAIANLAKKLHPNETEPIIILEKNKKQCLIQANDKVVLSMYKNIAS